MGAEALLETRDALDAIEIKNPCHVGWETMSGDERARHCPVCKLSVYNIAAMTRVEAMEFIAEREGLGACVRIFRRADGRVLTRDCSELRRAGRAKRWTAVAFVFVLALVLLPGPMSPPGGMEEVASRLKATRLYHGTKLGKVCIDWAEAALAPPMDEGADDIGLLY